MKYFRRLLIVLSCAILSVSAALIFASAGDDTGKVPVTKARSLSLKENVHILYAVDFGDLPSSAEYGVLAWCSGDASYVPDAFTHEYAATALDMKSEGTDTVDGVTCEVFRYDLLAARQMVDCVYAVPYVKYSGDSAYTYGKPTKYSIVQYTLGSAVTDDNIALLDAMLNYGAKAQTYYDYRLDRLANEDYVLASSDNAVFADGFGTEVVKPNEELDITSKEPSLVANADEAWYIASEDGTAIFYDDATVLKAPANDFTVTRTAYVKKQDYTNQKNDASTGKYKGDGDFGAFAKGNSYSRIIEEDGNKYLQFYRAPENGTSSANDAQYDTGNRSDPQPYMYNPATGEYKETKLTYSIKLSRTDADVAGVTFRLRRYNYDPTASGSSKRTEEVTLFTVDKTGTVLLCGSLPIGVLTDTFQTFSIVCDFGAGDQATGSTLYAYRDGVFIAEIRDAVIKGSSLISYDAAHDAQSMLKINLYSIGTHEGYLNIDDVTVTLGATPPSLDPGGLINYNLSGGILPSGAPTKYSYDEVTVLPIPTKENCKFEGWYTSQSYENRITQIPAGCEGIFEVFAKFTADDSYIAELREMNASMDNSGYYLVDTSNQYNLKATEYVDGATWFRDDYSGGVSTSSSAFTSPLAGKQDNYALADYAQIIRISNYIDLPTDKHPDPLGTPAGKNHPYLYFTEDDIDNIKAMLDHPDMAAAAKTLWSLADSDEFNGIFTASYKNGVAYHYSTDILAILEAKAFAYAITGEEHYGLQAIIGAKNAILTVSYTTQQHTDPYHGPLHVLNTVTKIYDWCYDLLTEKDKEAFILGVQNRLFPALEYNPFRVGQGLSSSYPTPGYINGHGTGPQVIKDWVDISLVLYHEVPSWWDYVGGSYFEQYVKTWEQTYRSGWVSQGTAGYGLSKYYYVLQSAFVVKNATGVTAPHTDIAYDGAFFLLSHVNGADRYFTNGDGSRPTHGVGVTHEYMIMHAALYNNAQTYEAARYFSQQFTRFMNNSADGITVPLTLIYASRVSEENKTKYDSLAQSMPLISYFGEGNGFMSSRNSWSSDGASVFMKIGEKTLANHDIADHGTFQIYYKGMLAGSSGAYNKYGSNVHQYYLQATVAHNGLLVFDPSRADATLESNNSNAARYYYSGSQYIDTSSISSIDNWLYSGRFDMGKVVGYDYAYNDDGSSKFAYIAGDITTAYHDTTVDYVGRRMLAVYTDDKTAPMMFFVFDSLTSDSADFTKTFLLHTHKEPTISPDGKSAVILSQYGGMMTLSLVSGADAITKRGGEGYAFWINGYYNEDGEWVEGKNLTDEYAPTDNYQTMWGRIEISMRGNLTDHLLTAMCISDQDSSADKLAESLYTSDNAVATKLGNVVAAFATDQDRCIDKITINSGSSGELLEYYVSGLSVGEWTVSIGSSDILTVNVRDESGLISFTAPSGIVNVTPGDGVPVGTINYITDGGMLSDDAEKYFFEDSVIELTDKIVKEGFVFEGWYTTPTFDEDSRIWVIKGSSHSGRVDIYAKWQRLIVFDNYSVSVIKSTSAGNVAVNGITYGSKNKVGASFTTKTENGIPYLEWIKGTQDPAITVQNSTYSIANSPSNVFSYTIGFSKNGSDKVVPLQMQIVHDQNLVPNAEGKTSTYKPTFFKFGTDGKFTFGSTVIPELALSADEVTWVRFVVDYEAGVSMIYDENGNVLATQSIPLDKSIIDVSTTMELKESATYSYMRLYAPTNKGTDGTIRIFGIRIEEGNVFKPVTTET